LPRWRLLVDAASHGAWNMGVDEALLMAATQGGQPALRLYRWSGPWLSVGYRQRVSDRLRAACASAGVGLVRRVSGGGAVVHGGDLTYALAAGERDLPAGIAASYQLIAKALVEALRAIGVAAAQPFEGRIPVARPALATGSNRTPAFDCFASAADHEICVAGRKLAGSAQRRAAGGVLQHGSIRLRANDQLAPELCPGGSGAAVSLAELGFNPVPEELQRACVKAFASVLGVEFEVGGLSMSERAWACWRVRNHPIHSDFAPRAIAGGPQGTESPADR
jgi:lipoate-protein ligase A